MGSQAYGFIWLSGPVTDGFEYLFRSLLGVLPILIPLDKDLGKRERSGARYSLVRSRTSRRVCSEIG